MILGNRAGIYPSFRILTLSSLCAAILFSFQVHPYQAKSIADQGPDPIATSEEQVFLPLLLKQSSSPPDDPDPTLLSAYLLRASPYYEIVKYRPRQFITGLDADAGDQIARVDDPGPYQYWDVLNAPNEGFSRIVDRVDWLVLTLNRPARLAIVWRGGDPLPGWLLDWERAEDILINGNVTPTYTKVFLAGEVILGSNYNPGAPDRFARDTYLVLFAEENGLPSSPPGVPPGEEIPQPNQTCPNWVHDQYMTTGPDGNPYRTWHQQIDPVYWCYFHHEHGSNPAPHNPPFGYAAAQAGMDENHEGFKVYKFNLAEDTIAVITHHFGTASAVKAACVRFHEFDIAIYKESNLSADLYLLGDHGKSQHARTDANLTPMNCPNQAEEADADGSHGVRKFQVASMDPVGYEPWRLDFSKTILGLMHSITFNTPSRISDCNTLNCNLDIATGDQGEFRFVVYDYEFGIGGGSQTGIFHTDPFGRKIELAEKSGSVRQFIVPGLEITFPPLDPLNECYLSNPFGGPMVCQEIGPLGDFINIEGALRSPN